MPIAKAMAMESELSSLKTMVNSMQEKMRAQATEMSLLRAATTDYVDANKLEAVLLSKPSTTDMKRAILAMKRELQADIDLKMDTSAAEARLSTKADGALVQDAISAVQGLRDGCYNMANEAFANYAERMEEAQGRKAEAREVDTALRLKADCTQLKETNERLTQVMQIVGQMAKQQEVMPGKVVGAVMDNIGPEMDSLGEDGAAKGAAHRETLNTMRELKKAVEALSIKQVDEAHARNMVEMQQAVSDPAGSARFRRWGRVTDAAKPLPLSLPLPLQTQCRQPTADNPLHTTPRPPRPVCGRGGSWRLAWFAPVFGVVWCGWRLPQRPPSQALALAPQATTPPHITPHHHTTTPPHHHTTTPPHHHTTTPPPPSQTTTTCEKDSGLHKQTNKTKQPFHSTLSFNHAFFFFFFFFFFVHGPARLPQPHHSATSRLHCSPMHEKTRQGL
jgi:hypothetical protein